MDDQIKEIADKLDRLDIIGIYNYVNNTLGSSHHETVFKSLLLATKDKYVLTSQDKEIPFSEALYRNYPLSEEVKVKVWKDVFGSTYKGLNGNIDLLCKINGGGPTNIKGNHCWFSKEDTAEKVSLTIEQLQINDCNRTIFITMFGMGDTTESSCKIVDFKKEKDLNSIVVKHINVQYGPIDTRTTSIINTYDMFMDAAFLTLRLTKKRLNPDVRIGKLVNVIKRELSNLKTENYDNIVILGFSHGSLIIHLAILDLLINNGVTMIDLQKLRIITVGSPRFLPQSLITGPDTLEERIKTKTAVKSIKDLPYILNIFDVSDQIISPLKSIPIFKIPTNLQPRISEPPYYQLFRNGVIITDMNSNPNEVSIAQGREIYHSHMGLLFPLLNRYTIFNYDVISVRGEYCSYSRSGGSKQKLFVKLTHDNKLLKRKVYTCGDKRYIVVNNKHVPLESIKGKYRYIYQ